MDIDVNVKINQMLVLEQKIVLETLAKSVAKPGCRFLEIGSWCGDSTVILGKIAQKYGGHLFCVDGWKGSVGTELDEIASKVDVFSIFWNRICEEGLEDVVVPIRTRSDIAAEILKENTFDFIFIDGDHRYDSVLQDIKLYVSLVNKDGGILCGHDCEGYISDYDSGFLESGKDLDFHETVHCGVVLAVGFVFEDYSINHSIWSIRVNGMDWEPTNLKYEGIKDKRQVIPPLIGFTKNYNVLRYGRLIYAVPHSLAAFDITDEESRKLPGMIKGESESEIERLLGEKICHDDAPLLLETYKNYNMVWYGNHTHAISQFLGPLDLTRLEERVVKEYIKQGKYVIADSVNEAKSRVDAIEKKPSRVLRRSLRNIYHFLKHGISAK